MAVHGDDRERAWQAGKDGEHSLEPPARGTVGKETLAQRAARSGPGGAAPAAEAAGAEASGQRMEDWTFDGGLLSAMGMGAPDAASEDAGAASSLPGETAARLGTALGTDVSGVRVHTGGAASARADAMNAKAYAVGQDIHFGAGMYDPSSDAGQHLIAHEVAHTVQQRGAAGGPQRAAKVSAPGDAAEQQAERFAGAFVSGESTEGLVSAGMRSEATIHRFGRDEHVAASTTHLIGLHEYLKTPEGKKWALDHGYKDPETLIRRMEADPVVKTKLAADASGRKDQGVAKLRGAKTQFSYGEVTAMMGDLFGTWERLYDADEEQRNHLMTEDSTSSNQKHTKGDYLRLAANNTSHFSGENQKEWLKLHKLATEKAMQAGKDDKRFEEALFVEAASTHFLTDAFSAGHQFEKAPLLAHIRRDLQKKSLTTENRQMQLYVGIAELQDSMNLPNLIVLAIHDRMNQEGFVVTNDRKMEWRTYGDGNLFRSPETQRIMALAVFESRQQIFAARGATSPPDPASILSFFPNEQSRERGNMQALAYVPEARRQVEDVLYANRKDAKSKVGAAGGYLVERNMNAIGAPGRERDLVRQQESDRVRGGDGRVMAPMLEWRFGKRR
jgi:Domain of unknown function (DUF4157)